MKRISRQMKRQLLTLCIAAGLLPVAAQPQFSKQHGLYDADTIMVSILGGADIRYTTDGSVPTLDSPRYTEPLVLKKTTILRAAEVQADTVSASVATATYLFVSSVLSQTNTPEGYPQTWGAYTTIDGTAVADYEMDPEMTGNPVLRPKIVEGLKSLPILSLVSDKGNFFSHENDPDRGGIYIFTGPPVGDATGHGWTRPASVELFGGEQQHDLSVDCGVRLHGGHGRLAEKNPKHSFRIVFKKQYGPGSLKYPLFGEDEPAQFNQLVLRCHFGNAWQHWDEGNRKKAQYTRDVWARRMQRSMGHTSVNALYVHLFLNGMYWGLYNVAERVDDQFGKSHLGGAKTDIDVVKIEEDGGNHIEAAEGDLAAWNTMVETAALAADDTYYYLLEGKDADGNDDPDAEVLLDIDTFIDYMLINQYGGNTDWAHHNWYAIRRRGADSQGFRFLCWDSEIIFENVGENVLTKNNGKESPTGIFQSLLRNEHFARRYLRRAKEVLAADGPLGQESVVALWDSLYSQIATALYVEAARWGDYRRDVHRWQTAGQLFTVDNHYMTERNRLLTEYFPVRSERVLGSIVNLVGIDDFEAPDGWVRLMADMFGEWNGTGINAQPTGTPVAVDWNVGSVVNGGGTIAGFSGVGYTHYADLSDYDYLVLRGTGSGVRILANRLQNHGPLKQIIVSLDGNDPRWDSALGVLLFPLEQLKTTPLNDGSSRTDDFVHLNALKVDYGHTANVTSAWLIPREQLSGIAALSSDSSRSRSSRIYTLSGQAVSRPVRGLYIRDGKKILVR